MRLDSSRGVFPMEWTDFGASGLPTAASWFLDWPDQDWEAPLLGALRLRLNANKSVVGEMLILPTEDPRRRLFLEAAKLDVAKQLIVAALTSDEFMGREEEFPESSVGYSVRLLIEGVFPHDGLVTLRERLFNHFGEFHLQLMAGLNAYDGSYGE